MLGQSSKLSLSGKTGNRRRHESSILSEATLRRGASQLRPLLPLSLSLEESRIENGPNMDDPTQKDEPQSSRQDKMKDGHEKPALNQLAKTWNEETSQSGDNVACGTLCTHR